MNREWQQQLRQPRAVGATFAGLGVILIIIWWQALGNREPVPCPGGTGFVTQVSVATIWVCGVLELLAIAVYWWLADVYRRRPAEDPEASLAVLPLGGAGQVLLALGAVATASGVLAVCIEVLGHSALACPT